VIEAAFPPLPLKPHEHHTVWLEDLFKLSENFDASIHWNQSNGYLLLGDPANLRNHEVRTLEKRGISVFKYGLYGLD
jgi:hypothetical protein